MVLCQGLGRVRVLENQRPVDASSNYWQLLNACCLLCTVVPNVLYGLAYIILIIPTLLVDPFVTVYASHHSKHQGDAREQGGCIVCVGSLHHRNVFSVWGPEVQVWAGLASL